MKISKDVRRLSSSMVRESFVNGELNADRVQGFVASVIKHKPRQYLQLLENYRRLLRLEADKRRARIESATELDDAAGKQIVADLQKRYGRGLPAEFGVNPASPGGRRGPIWGGKGRRASIPGRATDWKNRA